MMTNAVFQRRAFAAVESLILRHRCFSIAATTPVPATLAVQPKRFSGREIFHHERPLGFLGRGFHATPGPLAFRASAVSLADIAVDVDRFSSTDEGLEISKLQVAPEIVSALAKKGITKLFPIQRAVLEPAMQGRDMVGRARTGTGKTLAFGIPILDKIIKFNAQHGRGRNPLAIVLAPTRELAKQVETQFQEAAPSLDIVCVYGGTPIQAQMRQIGYGVDAVVGTPGRVIDLLNRGALNLSEVRFLVLDEADQMLQIGFQEAVETILQSVPKQRHTMMFSATMPVEIRRITQRYLKSPVDIDLVGDSDQKLADGISLYSIVSDMYSKASIIGPLVTQHAKGGKCIVFTQTKRDADRLSFAMSKSYKCEALHGDISQAQRERTLAGFREGHFNILVATDVASRGLDIPNVDLVIHYELPNSSEIFVHRSGRTGRAGKKGTAVLVHTRDQARSVKMIERDVGSRFTELSPMAGDSSIQMSSGGGSRFGGGGGGGYGGRFSGGGGGGSGRFGGGRSSGGYGSSSGGYGGSRSGGFGDFGGGGGSRSGGFGDFGGGGASRSGGFGDFGGGSKPSRSSGFGDFGGGSKPSRSGGFGDFGGSSSRRSGKSSQDDDWDF